jgi:negative regulator of flagellin synthesis FlgM
LFQESDSPMSYTTGLNPASLPLADDLSQTGSVSATNRTQAAANAYGSRSAVADFATDSAKVSLAGAMLSQAASGSDVRFEKVAALRQSIEAGAYNIPASAVASKLADSLLK